MHAVLMQFNFTSCIIYLFSPCMARAYIIYVNNIILNIIKNNSNYCFHYHIYIYIYSFYIYTCVIILEEKQHA